MTHRTPRADRIIIVVGLILEFIIAWLIDSNRLGQYVGMLLMIILAYVFWQLYKMSKH